MASYSIGLIAISLLFFSSDVISRALATTLNIRNIFIGRCYEYAIGPGRNFNPEPRDCKAIWNAYASAWSLKDPWAITQNDYNDFFNLTRQTNLPKDKTLIWSGTYDIAHTYANGGKRNVTLEDTLVGYLVNGLSTSQVFWRGASKTFAESAQGLVSILVNGTKPNNQPAYNDKRPRDCKAIWNAYASAWSLKDPWAITQNDYKDFFNLTRQTNLPKDKTLIWSGTYDIAHTYANGGKRNVTLEDTLVGYLVNGLSTSQVFWRGASKTFAESAQGLVSILVNGTKPNNQPAYNDKSFMAMFELPNLKKHVNIRVVLLNDLDKNKMEHCDTGSMVSMRRAIESHGFQYVCVENPDDVLHLMCVDHPQHKICLLPKVPVVATGGGQLLPAKSRDMRNCEFIIANGVNPDQFR